MSNGQLFFLILFLDFILFTVGIHVLRKVKAIDVSPGRINKGPCNKCNELPDANDHDPCLGGLPGLMNACCGHGEDDMAYVQFLDGVCVRGESALVIINELKKVKGD